MRRARKRYSYESRNFTKRSTSTSRAKYTFSLLGACLLLCPQLRPPAIKSIPYQTIRYVARTQLQTPHTIIDKYNLQTMRTREKGRYPLMCKSRGSHIRTNMANPHQIFEFPKSNLTFFLLLSIPTYSLLQMTHRIRLHLCFEQLPPW